MSNTDLEHTKRIHFIGIGGAGMGGIAEILKHQGHEVTGSDLTGQSPMIDRLKRLQIPVYTGHKAEHIEGAELIVVSTAIDSNNPELIAAKTANLPIFPRALMLAELMRKKFGIAIAGTHGKTTTTSLVTSLLTEANWDPTFVIGGLLKSAGANAQLGKSDYFVAEADESDASFLYLDPKMAIVTNIDADHMSTYGGDFNRLRQAFIEFLSKLPQDGAAVVCLDDAGVQSILPQLTVPVVTYGFSADADIQVREFQPIGFQTHFILYDRRDNTSLPIELNLPGRHNASNAASAYAIVKHLGMEPAVIQRAFQQFAGVGRRLQIYGDLTIRQGSVLLIDDYGHHPREIMATWSAIRQGWPDRRLVVVYQPHRYTRTQDLFGDFVEVLSGQTDKLILLDVYSAGETPIPGADGLALFTAIQSGKSQPVFVPELTMLAQTLRDTLQEGDILLTQGAGNIGAIAAKLAIEGLTFA